MRLYRGLKEPYRPEKVTPSPGQPVVGTDFTDCPRTALRYAEGRRGVVLVLDVPSGTFKVTEELWLGARGAKRVMAWGRFDEFLTAVLPAKDLRSLIRVKGVAGQSDEYKAMVLGRSANGSTTRPARRRAGARRLRRDGLRQPPLPQDGRAR